MTEHFEVITNAQTGEVTTRPYTPEEIAACEAAAAAQRVPKSVDPRQVRLVLLAQGLLTSVEAMIAEQDEATQITWKYAPEFRRNDPLLAQLAANLVPPLTSQQLDEFFIAAAAL